MTTTILTTTDTGFDYGAHKIAQAEAKGLENHAKVICETQDRVRKTTAEAVLKIGKELTEARERLANHKNGTFQKWCVERCGASLASTKRAIAAYEQFGNRHTVSQYFDATAMYLLSANSCPEDTRDEFIQRAEAGEQITAKMVREELTKDKFPLTERERAERLIQEMRSFLERGIPTAVRKAFVEALRDLYEESKDNV